MKACQKNNLKLIALVTKCLLTMFACLAWVVPAQAASFDCAKASTKVENLICADVGLSKLDEEIAKVYGEVLVKSTDEDLLKKHQRDWIKARKQCKDIPCVSEYYRGRLAELNEANVFKSEESYTLLMSKDDKLCNYMMKLFNQDLKQYGWRGDEHQEEHEEFKRVPWQPARFSSVIDGRTEYTDVEGALFDFNNDGVQDFVVRWQSSLSNARADSLDIFDAETVKRASNLTAAEIGGGKDKIHLAGGFYDVSLPVKTIGGPRVLQPFIYHETSYLFMRRPFEISPITPGYAVIAKYGGGTFTIRDVTGKMDDICYYQRNRAKRKH
jgi:uncharacterized protein